MAKATLSMDMRNVIEDAARRATLRHIRQIKASALREAADDLYGDNGPGHPLSTAAWLRDRAAALEASDD